MLLLRLLLFHSTADALVRQLRLYEIHLGAELCRLLKLLLPNTQTSFVHFNLHICDYLLFGISVVQRLLHVRSLVYSVWLASLRPKSCVVLIGINEG